VLAKRLSKREIQATKTYSGTEALQALAKQDFALMKPCEFKTFLTTINNAYQFMEEIPS